jgi:hypothetical protein
MMGCPRSEAEAVLDDLRAQNIVALDGRQTTIFDLDRLRSLAED